MLDPVKGVCCEVCKTYSFLSRLRDVFVCCEEGADVESLSSPEISIHGPVEGEFEGSAVEVSVCLVRGAGSSNDLASRPRA